MEFAHDAVFVFPSCTNSIVKKAESGKGLGASATGSSSHFYIYISRLFSPLWELCGDKEAIRTSVAHIQTQNKKKYFEK